MLGEFFELFKLFMFNFFQLRDNRFCIYFFDTLEFKFEETDVGIVCFCSIQKLVQWIIEKFILSKKSESTQIIE